MGVLVWLLSGIPDKGLFEGGNLSDRFELVLREGFYSVADAFYETLTRSLDRGRPNLEGDRIEYPDCPVFTGFCDDDVGFTHRCIGLKMVVEQAEDSSQAAWDGEDGDGVSNREVEEPDGCEGCGEDPAPCDGEGYGDRSP